MLNKIIRRGGKNLIGIMLMFVFMFMYLGYAQSLRAQWDIKSEGDVKTAAYTVDFSDDSLKTVWTGALDIGKFSHSFINSQTAVFEDETDTNTVTVTQYDPALATISLKSIAVSIVDNWTVTTYLSNFLTSDTTEMNISQSWNTTGQYLAKPINDTLNTSLNGLPFKYLYVKIKGAAGNREAVVLKLGVVFRKD